MNTVLLVEDVEDNRELARFLLETEGYEVIEAHNGLEAIALALEHRPSLVLMDLSLPEMDGWEAARRIMEAPETAGIPIVAVTAHAMAGDREKVLEAGFKGYITKPIDVNSFGDAVRLYMPRLN